MQYPKTFVIYDCEFTAWEGSLQRNWQGSGEFRELVQLAAIRVDSESWEELDSFTVYCRPTLSPVLSDYFIHLTGVQQETVNEQGVSLSEALGQFLKWSQGELLYSYAPDNEILEANCVKLNVDFPFEKNRFVDIKELLRQDGVDVDSYTSGHLIEAFGSQPSRRAHDALNDVRNLLDALKLHHNNQ